VPPAAPTRGRAVSARTMVAKAAWRAGPRAIQPAFMTATREECVATREARTPVPAAPASDRTPWSSVTARNELLAGALLAWRAWEAAIRHVGAKWVSSRAHVVSSELVNRARREEQ
jgi:hypothetical protein